MLKAINENGEMKNLITNEDGVLRVEVINEGESGGGNNNTVVTNSDQNPVPIKNVEKECTIKSNILTVGTAASTVDINQKVTSIMAANYSDEADITINTGSQDLKVGANLAVELPINADIASLSITSTADNTKMQLVVKGVL